MAEQRDGLLRRLFGRRQASGAEVPVTILGTQETVQPRAFEPPAYFSGTYRSGLSGTSGQPSGEMLLRAVHGWQGISARAIGDRLASLELMVCVRRRITDGTVLEEELDDHILSGVLADPNPIFSMDQMLWLLGHWLVQSGEGYWLKVTDRLRVTRELWPLPPSKMEILTDRATQIAGYVFHSEAGEFTYQPDEVIRFWRPDPAYPYLAIGNLGPQAKAYDTALFIDETMKEHFQNDATPKTALVAGEDASPFSSDEERAFSEQWRQHYSRRVGTQRGVPAIVPTGYSLHEFGGVDGFEALVGVLQHYRDQIFMANGVPRSIVGDVVDANRAAAETNQYVFDRHTILPIATLVAKTLSRRLARDYDPKLLVKFREFVSDDKDFTLRQEDQDLRLKVRSINQLREDRNLDPVPWGDEPVGSIADVPYDPDAARDNFDGAMAPDDPAAFDAPEDEESDEGEEEPRTRSLERGYFSPGREWKRVVGRERKFAPRFRSALLSIFTEQKRSVLERLRKPRERATAFDLFDPEEWITIFRARLEVIRRSAFFETVADTYLGLELKVQDFIFNDRVRKRLEQQAAALVTNVNQTTQRRLARAISAGQAEGESIAQLAKRVNEVFQGRRANAQTIARTEVLKATQAAQLESFEQSGVVEKREWRTARDPRVRDSHLIDGEVRASGDVFILGNGEAADAPGIGANGADLSAGNAINCRCFLLPVIE